MFEEDVYKIVNDLILEGGLEVSGIDTDSGEILYSFTPKIKELMPELYNDHINSVNREIMGLWEKGMIDVDFFQEEPMISLNNKSYDESEIIKLSKHEQWSLYELKRILRLKEL